MVKELDLRYLTITIKVVVPANRKSFVNATVRKENVVTFY
jgi:hypothetical protein